MQGCLTLRATFGGRSWAAPAAEPVLKDVGASSAAAHGAYVEAVRLEVEKQVAVAVEEHHPGAVRVGLVPGRCPVDPLVVTAAGRIAHLPAGAATRRAVERLPHPGVSVLQRV